MDSAQAFCPNMGCPARGQSGKGNIGVHSQKDPRFICRQCGKTFAERTGTAFYRLRTPTKIVTLVVMRLAHGCPIQAIVAAFGFAERTVADGLDWAGLQCRAVHEHLVETAEGSGRCRPMNCGSSSKAPSSGCRGRSWSRRGCGSGAS
jgi:transposase-like protein